MNVEGSKPTANFTLPAQTNITTTTHTQEKVSVITFGASQNTVSITRSDIPPSTEKFEGISPEMQLQLRKTTYVKEDQIVRFYPAKENWEYQLDGLQSFYSKITSHGAFVFSGEICEERFFDALSHTLSYFECLFGRLYQEKEGWMLKYSKESYVPLELGKISKNTSEVSIKELLFSKTTSGYMQTSEGVPIAKFTLMQLNNGYAIGYSLNHAFFDQSSTHYFFKFLSDMYSSGSESPRLKEPTLFNLNSLLNENDEKYTNVEQVREGGVSGLKYTLNKTEFFTKLMTPSGREQACLRFDLAKVEKLKSETQSYISTNDLIHAVFCKIWALNPSIAAEQSLSLSYALNSRKSLGLQEETIGNIVTTAEFVLTKEEINSRSLIELAQLNRESLNSADPQYFKKGLLWFNALAEFKENIADYIPLNIVDPASWIMSNWSSFDYDQIKFDGAAPISLLPHFPSNMNCSMIVFKVIDGVKYLEMPMEISKEVFEQVIEMGSSTGLFQCETYQETH